VASRVRGGQSGSAEVCRGVEESLAISNRPQSTKSTTGRRRRITWEIPVERRYKLTLKRKPKNLHEKLKSENNPTTTQSTGKYSTFVFKHKMN
jgi:hypothetical protein